MENKDKVAEEVEQTQQEVILALPLSLAQDLVNYFVERPYREAAGYIDALRRLNSVDEE